MMPRPSLGTVWSAEEDELLRQGKPVPGRSVRAINSRRAKFRINLKNPHASALQYDRDGRSLTSEQEKMIFVKLYPDIEALRRVWPDITKSQIHCRVKRFKCATDKLKKGHPPILWKKEEDQVIIDLYPSYPEIRASLKDRSLKAIEYRSRYLRKIGLIENIDRSFTKEEDDLIRKNIIPVGRSYGSFANRRMRIGIRVKNQFTDSDFSIIEKSVPRGLPRHIREDVVAEIALFFAEKRSSPTPKTVAALVRSTITSVYRMHPDRGAPTSLDATVFEDGATTFGDRLSSDTFRF